MCEPLFEAEYRKSIGNRYRFAWVVATKVPLVHASDVDQDLIFTARCALEKDWRTRLSLSLEDFMHSTSIKQRRALEMIGLGPDLIVSDGTANRLSRVNTITEQVRAGVISQLRKSGIITEHSINPGEDDVSKILTFEWEAHVRPNTNSMRHVTLDLRLSLSNTRQCFTSSVTLYADIDGMRREACLSLPEVADTDESSRELVEHTYRSLGMLAKRLMASSQ